MGVAVEGGSAARVAKLIVFVANYRRSHQQRRLLRLVRIKARLRVRAAPLLGHLRIRLKPCTLQLAAPQLSRSMLAVLRSRMACIGKAMVFLVIMEQLRSMPAQGTLAIYKSWPPSEGSVPPGAASGAVVSGAVAELTSTLTLEASFDTGAPLQGSERTATKVEAAREAAASKELRADLKRQARQIALRTLHIPDVLQGVR
jgi:hypothetical protein